MNLVVDDLGNKIALKFRLQRIISTVPSQTELLSYLGLDTEVVAITSFCAYPKNWRKSKQLIGGTKTLNVQQILDLKPDLIIANKEENEKEQITYLQKYCPVYVSDVVTIADSLRTIIHIGKITSTEKKSRDLVSKIEHSFGFFKKEKAKGTCAYVIWNGPLMVAGGNTFINSMLIEAGFQNIFSKSDLRYPITSRKELAELQVDYVFLSSEPYPFKSKNKTMFEEWLPMSKVELVDGRIFSWYGSSLLLVSDYFTSLYKRLQ